jgi:hypothetical protein
LLFNCSMKHFWYVPLLLQALAGPPSDRCVGLEGDARSQCEARVREEMNQPPPPPPILANPRERAVPKFRTGQEFDSNRTFSGQEEGTPGY